MFVAKNFVARQVIKTIARNQSDSSSHSTSATSNHSSTGDAAMTNVSQRSGDQSGMAGNGESGELGSDVLSQMAVDAAIRNAAPEAGKANAADASSGVKTPAEQKALDGIKEKFQSRFAENASNKEKFHEMMKKSFGESYDQAKAENIRQKTLNGDFSWMPKIQLVDSSTLADKSGMHNGAVGKGAYSAESDTIFLNRELLAKDPVEAEKILTEEVGHALDARINTSDAAGDEGAIFSILSHGGEISAEKMQELKTENDKGTIVVNGKKVEVEFGLRSKLRRLGRKIKKGVKKIGRKIRRGVSRIGKSIRRGIKKLGRKLEKGFKKLMQSKLFNQILTIASFIPIPFVQVAVRVINIAKAAYMTYQGIKHGSIGMVLGGVAGAAGGVAGLGKAMNSTGAWVGKAADIAKVAKTASMAHTAISQKNFGAAISLAKDYFGPNHAASGALNVLGKVDSINTSIQKGDIASAVAQGTSLAQNYTGDKTDAVLNRIGDVAGQVNTVQQAVDKGDYATAITSGASLAQHFTGDKGDAFLDTVIDKTHSIDGAAQRVEKAADSANEGDYSDVVGVFRTELNSEFNVPNFINNGLINLENGVERIEDKVENVKADVEAFQDKTEAKFEDFKDRYVG